MKLNSGNKVKLIRSKEMERTSLQMHLRVESKSRSYKSGFFIYHQ